MILSTWKWAVLTRKFVEFSGFSPPLHMILCIAQVNVQQSQSAGRFDQQTASSRQKIFLNNCQLQAVSCLFGGV
jgi:hypothetical protein